MTTLLIATRNAHKVGEIQAILGDRFRFLTLNDFPGAPAVIEDADTFAGNATKKAVELARWLTGKSINHQPSTINFVLADDSGLEVDALNGAPGVRSARFAADSGLTDSPDANDNTDVWNNIVLLQKLDGIPADRRTARYRCVLAAARDGEVLFTSEGAVDGTILEAPHGTGGFGYDPLFYLPELDQTMADLDISVKFALSHRGLAFAELLPRLVS